MTCSALEDSNSEGKRGDGASENIKGERGSAYVVIKEITESCHGLIWTVQKNLNDPNLTWIFIFYFADPFYH
jgi:hypothetical protein